MKIGLVIEGGGFRGVFCEGITSFLIEQNIEIPYVIGVSMGAINGTNYLSKQPRRNLEIIEIFLNDKRYLSKRNLIKEGNLFGMDFIFNDIAYNYHPFDFDTFSNSSQSFTIVSMNCLTGKSHYTNNANHSTQDMMKALRASTSLPFVSRQVIINEVPHLDGGITDPIPVQKALDDGCDKVIVLLTRDSSYVKEPFKGKRISRLYYRQHPEVASKLASRHIAYQKSQQLVHQLEKKRKALVFQPKQPLKVGRTEKNFNKIQHAFNQGYQLAKKRQQEIHDFIYKEN